MIYTDDELPFLDAFFDRFPDMLTGQVYADFLEEAGRPEAQLVRYLSVISGQEAMTPQSTISKPKNETTLELVKWVHRNGYKTLFEGIKQGDTESLPLSTMANGWHTFTLQYSPPVKHDPRVVTYFTADSKGLPFSAAENVVVPAKTWTEIVWNQETHYVNRRLNRYPTLYSIQGGEPGQVGDQLGRMGTVIESATVPGIVKKAMFIGFLNHVRKACEVSFHVSRPRNKKVKHDLRPGGDEVPEVQLLRPELVGSPEQGIPLS